MKAHDLNLKIHVDDLCFQEDPRYPWPSRSNHRPFALPASCVEDPLHQVLPLVMDGLRIAGTIVGWVVVVAAWAVAAAVVAICAVAYMAFFMWLGGAISDELLGE